MLKLLVAGNTGLTNQELDKIRSMGFIIDVMERETSALTATDYDVVICNFLFVNHDIRLFTDLKAVQLLSAGIDRMPMDYAEKQGIEVRNARGIYSIPIAEFVVMATLEVYKQSFFFYDNQKNHQWEKRRDLDELSDKTVCVFGTGSVGTEVAKRFSAFTDNVIGVDLEPTNKKYFRRIFGLCEIKEALGKSDVIVLTLPLTEETHHMFGLELFEMMKDDAVFINVSRGGLIDDASLKNRVESGMFRSVILDVFEKEPLDEHYWGWDAERVRIIPHNSFVSLRNHGRMKEQIFQNLKEWAFRLG